MTSSTLLLSLDIPGIFAALTTKGLLLLCGSNRCVVARIALRKARRWVGSAVNGLECDAVFERSGQSGYLYSV